MNITLNNSESETVSELLYRKGVSIAADKWRSNGINDRETSIMHNKIAAQAKVYFDLAAKFDADDEADQKLNVDGEIASTCTRCAEHDLLNCGTCC